ncbi:YihY/virulence factor BrkB family protein [Adhaeribacter aquaticus]|uniref:YihY/virulence factor BrkB family protein n=1 Tax=Adhaeribacter aquaticus TaxID=299567 RepID=UPI00040F6DA4|nr:YihY/virulence factor BrkB family protein [Adhaeribacter aquaticus]
MAHYTLKDIWQLTKNTVGQFMENNSFRLAAALAYNTIFSLPPLLLIIIAAAGAIWGEEAVSGQLESQLGSMVGADAAASIQNMIKNINQSGKGGIASTIGIGTLIFAATTFFITLQDSLNSIWNVRAKPTNNIVKILKDRFLSFGLILSIALLMLVSLLISAILTLFTDYLQQTFPTIAIIFIHILNIIVSLAFITFLFALIYKYLPDAIIRWKDVWVGSFLTSLLFVIGKFLISWYIGRGDVASPYGAAGSVIIILVWIYYSSLIIFFGSEFTQQYANTFGEKIRPKPHAVEIEIREVQHEDSDDSKAGRPKSEGRFRKE